MDGLEWPSWSAATRVDSPAWSIRVATVLPSAWLVIQSYPAAVNASFRSTLTWSGYPARTRLTRSGARTHAHRHVHVHSSRQLRMLGYQGSMVSPPQSSGATSAIVCENVQWCPQ